MISWNKFFCQFIGKLAKLRSIGLIKVEQLDGHVKEYFSIRQRHGKVHVPCLPKKFYLQAADPIGPHKFQGGEPILSYRADRVQITLPLQQRYQQSRGWAVHAQPGLLLDDDANRLLHQEWRVIFISQR